MKQRCWACGSACEAPQAATGPSGPAAAAPFKVGVAAQLTMVYCLLLFRPFHALCVARVHSGRPFIMRPCSAAGAAH